MSWYFLGGFSAYWMLPSARFLNHSGCSPIQGWSGAHWKAMSSAMSMSSPRAAATRRLKSASVPSAGRIASWPPSKAPIAQGLPTSSVLASRVLLRPLRRSRPIGWMGGKYSTSKPMPLT